MLKISVSFMDVCKRKQIILRWNSAVLPVELLVIALQWGPGSLLLSSIHGATRKTITHLSLSFYSSFCQSTSQCLSLAHVSLITIIIISLIISAHLCFSLVRRMKWLHFGAGTLQGAAPATHFISLPYSWQSETVGDRERLTMRPSQINRKRRARLTRASTGKKKKKSEKLPE